ncbi:cation-translocating P-type ATPase [Massilimaliae timonensis]|uniref:P-type Ca(2+) transporter n=1 Tax=Massiliimalia timonensis TaxID=1987501 RepID=A0A8J6PLT7_9FIRM|nr:cation-translocating P-type ATPase [Massiliimalia timonensis]MBC8611975.1 cation-translocating P-type ATPase [Massiliimalia timonensis]
MKEFYKCPSAQLLSEYDSGFQGLTRQQAEQALKRFGENRLQEEKKKGPLQVFIEQFKDLLVIILIVAGIISMFTGNLESTIVIFAVIILNAILGTVQHFKAEKSLESLRSLSSPNAKVLRDGERQEIPSALVVPGDVVVLEAGDLVPADGRIIECHSLQVQESALTGEAESVDKTEEIIEGDHIALGDQKNMVFSSSLVTYGRALVLVTSTGMDTEIGRIATLMNTTQERRTPLQVSLDNFSKKLSILILAVCALVFGISLFRQMPVLDSLMFAVALAVAAIPEALSSIVTISLAIGTSKMAKEHAIMKKLQAVEGLGCVSVICSDKTGTLTQNRMTVTDSYVFDPSQSDRLQLASILCNDGSVSGDSTLGDPTETALIDAYRLAHTDYFDMLKQYPRQAELPFDSDRKLMSTVHQIGQDCLLLTKGAPDVLLQRVDHITDQGIVRPITDEDREVIRKANQSFSEQGLRVLAFAQKILNSCEVSQESENGYTFLGLVAMVDPPRAESAQAVADCYRAGIKPIMITGDHVATASAIAKKIGILKDGDLAVTGSELDQMDDETLSHKLPHISVYARVSPEHKIRIVGLWQKLGNVVAMTGDGVNDAPALKKADIGIAMGITGTEVSKDAASMILTDDNFATIIKAVANGRNIYSNIKNAIGFLLSGNTAGILAVLFCSLMGLPVPFAAVHLLFINLLTDSLPAIAVSMEPPAKELLHEPPRDSKESILTSQFLSQIVTQGILLTIATLVAFYLGLTVNAATASTMAFATLCLGRLWHGFNARGKGSLVKLGFFKNPYSIGAFCLGAGLLALVLLCPPLERLFSIAPLNGFQLLAILVCSIVPTLLIQLFRIIRGK